MKLLHYMFAAVLAFASLARAGDSLLGMNIPAPVDYGPAIYADAMRHSRPWGKVDAPWTPLDAALIANGYPVSDHGVLLATEQVDAGGTYRISFTGGKLDRVTANGSIAATNYVRTPNGPSSCTVTLPAGATNLSLNIYGSNLRGHKVIRPGCTDADLFDPAYIDRLKPFGVLRMMDAQATNNSRVTTWASRQTSANVSYADSGMPLEDCVAMANAAGDDLWVCIPHGANDDYIARTSALIKTGLDPRLRCYVELSNELWNLGDFDQAKANWAAAKTDASLAVPWNDEWTRATNRIASESLRVARIVRPVLGDRGRVLLPLQVVQAKNTCYVWGEWFKANGARPADWFYGVAGAPYAELDALLVNKATATPDELLAGLAPNRTRAPDVLDMIAGARAMGLVPVAYEGGPNLINSWTQVPAKVALQSDPRFGPWLADYYAGWFDAGGGPFAHYYASSAYLPIGANFGAFNDARRPGPKYAALTMIAAKYPATRPPTPPATQPTTVPATQPTTAPATQPAVVTIRDVWFDVHDPARPVAIVNYSDGSQRILR